MDDLSEDQAKVWDGAGLISRAMLERLLIPPSTSAAKRAELLEELRDCKRVEFTLMSSLGQDIRSCYCRRRPRSRFCAARRYQERGQADQWTEVCGHQLRPCPRLYAQWLDDEGKLFAHAVESGEVGEAMSRIDPFARMEDVETWHLREYFMLGGHPMWFANVSRNLMNQHLDRLNQTTLEKMRLPIPGGRYYVMPMGVGQVAGVDHVIPRGQVRIDAEYGTAWVNDEDWLAMQDSPTGAGIRYLLGRADNDDALWLHPFTGHDGAPKVIAWRSPNQAGEYVVLQPTLGSRLLEWKTVEGNVTFPQADSRKLFPRTDTRQRDYLALVDLHSATAR